jgi:hypothetical protein
MQSQTEEQQMKRAEHSFFFCFHFSIYEPACWNRHGKCPIFVELSSTKERTYQSPPPKKKIKLTENRMKLFTILHIIHNFANRFRFYNFQARSNTEQMPALVIDRGSERLFYSIWA